MGLAEDELAKLPPQLAQKLADLALREPPAHASAGIGGLQDANLRSLAPYEVPATLQATVEQLNLARNLAEMEEQGYTVLEGCADEAMCDRLCELLRPGGQGHVLGNNPHNDDVWAAVTAPKMLALSEVLCGKGFRLSQCAASVQPENPSQTGLPKGGLHADANWVPAPFPEHNQIVTGCFVLSDEYSELPGPPPLPTVRLVVCTASTASRLADPRNCRCRLTCPCISVGKRGYMPGAGLPQATAASERARASQLRAFGAASDRPSRLYGRLGRRCLAHCRRAPEPRHASCDAHHLLTHRNGAARGLLDRVWTCHTLKYHECTRLPLLRSASNA